MRLAFTDPFSLLVKHSESRPAGQPVFWRLTVACALVAAVAVVATRAKIVSSDSPQTTTAASAGAGVSAPSRVLSSAGSVSTVTTDRAAIHPNETTLPPGLAESASPAPAVSLNTRRQSRPMTVHAAPETRFANRRSATQLALTSQVLRFSEEQSDQSQLEPPGSTVNLPRLQSMPASYSKGAGVPAFVVPPARNASDARAMLSQHGLTIGMTTISDASVGSTSMKGARAVRTYNNVALALDFDSLIGWPGLKLSAEHSFLRGKNGSEEAAFAQSFSNIDTHNFRSAGEVLLEQQLMQGRLRLKVGRLDFNTEFAGTDNGGDFLNSSMGFSPTITGAPSYPLPSNGVNVAVTPLTHVSFVAGLFDGICSAPAAPGGSSRFAVVQMNERWALGTQQLRGRLGFGVFRHTGMFASADQTFDATAPDITGAGGWYATFDQLFWQRAARTDAADEDAGQSIAGFAQYGKADRRVLGVHTHAGAGMTFAGLLPLLRTSVVGLGATRAKWSDGEESIGELFLKQPIVSGLTLEGDMQMVDRLNGESGRQHGRVFILRTVVTF